MYVHGYVNLEYQILDHHFFDSQNLYSKICKYLFSIYDCVFISYAVIVYMLCWQNNSPTGHNIKIPRIMSFCMRMILIWEVILWRWSIFYRFLIYLWSPCLHKRGNFFIKWIIPRHFQNSRGLWSRCAVIKKRPFFFVRDVIIAVYLN